MEFCPKCKKMLTVKEDEENEDILVCPACGYEKKGEEEKHSTTEVQEKKLGIAVIENPKEGLPETDKMCPECGNGKAYWELRQMRSADEAPSRFYTCTKCGHTWREDN